MKKIAFVIASVSTLVLTMVMPAKSFAADQTKSIKAASANAALNCGGNGTGGL